MTKREKLVRFLVERYESRTPRSREAFARAEKVMVRGGSHTLRLFRPYPFFVRKAQGATVEDLDGGTYIDYWQGHYANVLGHNPPELAAEVERLAGRNGPLHTGFESEFQVLLAERLLERLGWKGHKVRFTTSGTLAAMSAVLLAQGFTGREKILKVAGGWHGASPMLLKGVKYGPGGYEHLESAGLPERTLRNTLLVKFNDLDDLERVVRKAGDKAACFIVEPFLGAGGFLPATSDYLAAARRLCDRHGIVLIFDEIVSGFRFGPAGVQTLYGVEPDLAAFGKVIGGGHAVAAVTGKRFLLDCCETKAPAARRVLFEGGTFSSHPQYMKAGLAMLNVLSRRSKTIYPRLGAMGEALRRGVEKAFAVQGFRVQCTGDPDPLLGGSSMFMVNFPKDSAGLRSAEDVADPARCDVALKEDVLKLALMTMGVHVVHGGGAVSAAHQTSDIDRTLEAYAEAARLFKSYLF
ncbi:MAG: aminotransferase class III-fold pyridoxal phosphate-dependent enzyme [Candidatus Aminicenantes bacterium]|nr:aminotransferase class III-fold pyridoxal phosphate-dependent enzyme [Candidatus Aminicenantes bacterium]